MASRPDLTGKIFGRLTVLRLSHTTSQGKRAWACRCECGIECTVYTYDLQSGRTPSCGCWKREKIGQKKLIPMIGRRFGRLVVLERVDDSPSQEARYKVQCDCGITKEVVGISLRNGATQSCGCWREELRPTYARIHGGSHTSEWRTWVEMRRRCTDSNNPAYPNYGGRGIYIVDRWLTSFANFLADMGPKPGPAYSIERRDNNGPYSPGNCYWATKTEQAENKRNNRLITFQGETKPLSAWARQIDVSRTTLKLRLKRGWSVAKTLTTPWQGKRTGRTAR